MYLTYCAFKSRFIDVEYPYCTKTLKCRAIHQKTYESIYAGETNNRFMLLVSTKQKCDLGEMLESCLVKIIPAAFLHRLYLKFNQI